jgi:hypothetical protein
MVRIHLPPVRHPYDFISILRGTMVGYSFGSVAVVFGALFVFGLGKMTRRREWPNAAKEARDRSAEEAVVGIRALEPVVLGDRQMTRTEQLRRQSVALNALQKIARFLEGVGAETRPE